MLNCKLQGVFMKKLLNFENQILDIENIDFIKFGLTSQAGLSDQYDIVAYNIDGTEHLLFSSFDLNLALKQCENIQNQLKANKIYSLAQVGHNFVNLEYMRNLGVIIKSIKGQVFFTLKFESKKSCCQYEIYNGRSEVANKLKLQLLKLYNDYKKQNIFE